LASAVDPEFDVMDGMTIFVVELKKFAIDMGLLETGDGAFPEYGSGGNALTN
jgi:hypothetical protein